VPALVGFGAAGKDGEGLVDEWSRVVRDGGTLVLVDRVPPANSSAVALCAGLADIAQRTSGRDVITSGVVVDLDAAAG
jgi:hypothetical protein